MDLPEFLLFAILCVVLSGIPEATSTTWNQERSRSAGYDLERGPVLYEAYYPERQEPDRTPDQPIAIHPQAGNVLDSSSDLEPYKSEKVARLLQGFVERLQQATSLTSSELYASKPDHISASNYPPYQNNNPNERLGDSINIILSAIRDSALKISQETQLASALAQDKEKHNMRLSSPERLIESEGFRRPFDHEDDVRGSTFGMAFRRMENIFQPRPQVISYAFSPTTTPTKARFSFDQRSTRSSDKDANSNEPGIASLEVSELPRHKTRHHHGERPRRSHSKI